MNRLASETSPYLRQHADNPVEWYPWGSEAFELARSTDRAILLSIGYSACHWCHVMAHESFEDAATAALMNELFVCVKVDREQRPDVDAIYMEATVAMTGHGGWPMTVFLTPDGEPFYCGTYFPKVRRGGMPSFTELLAAIGTAWRDERGDLVEQATRITEHLRREPELGGAAALDAAAAPALLDRAEAGLLAAFDPVWGGFGRAPKFPQSMSIEFLLRRVRHLPPDERVSTEAVAATTRCLDAMSAGGIYDHLGGGFARYSVDERWLVPHFEKMLYDNALLIRPYLHSWQLTGNPGHRLVVDETIAYLLRDLRHPAGGFYSAEDADSEGVEGKFYVWTTTELRTVLGDESKLFCDWYGVTDDGNFEGANILVRPVGGFERPTEIDELRHRVRAVRSRRVRPGLDDKVLTEWNALALASLAEAAAATGDEVWRTAAIDTAEFLVDSLRGAEGRWLRSWQAEIGATHLAYAQDHAALVDAFTRVYELTGQRRWLDEATDVADRLVGLFWDPDGGTFWTTGSDAEALLTRPRDLQDNATPSAQSTAAMALYRLAPLAERGDFASIAERIGGALGEVAGQHPLAFANLLAAVESMAHGLDEVVICGDRPDLVDRLQRRWDPDAVLSWGDRLDRPLWAGRTEGLAYVCRGSTCGLPASTVAELEAQLP